MQVKLSRFILLVFGGKILYTIIKIFIKIFELIPLRFEILLTYMYITNYKNKTTILSTLSCEFISCFTETLSRRI